MKLFMHDEESFEEDRLKESERMCGRRDDKEVDVSDLSGPILAAHRKAEELRIIGASRAEQKKADKELYLLLREKKQRMDSANAARLELSMQIEALHRPTLDYLEGQTSRTMHEIARNVFFRRDETKTNLLTDKREVIVTHNLSNISAARSLVVAYRGALHGMKGRPLSELKALTEKFEKQINAIDLRQVEKESLSPRQYEEMNEAATGTVKLAALPTPPRADDFSALDDGLASIYHKVKKTVREVMGGPIEPLRVPSSKK
jgi:hypothetical protein